MLPSLCILPILFFPSLIRSIDLASRWVDAAVPHFQDGSTFASKGFHASLGIY